MHPIIKAIKEMNDTEMEKVGRKPSKKIPPQLSKALTIEEIDQSHPLAKVGRMVPKLKMFNEKKKR